MTPDALITALTERRRIAEPVALVVAHPDDEAIGLGGSLSLFDKLLLITVTDGGAGGNAALRAAELAAAVQGRVAASVQLGLPDQGVSARMVSLALDLSARLRDWGAAAVLTHPYEGGHPDHDATAFAVHAATWVPVIEMAFYHRAPEGGWQIGRFLDGSGSVAALDVRAQGHKQAMFAAHASQAGVLARFSTAQEAFRAARLPDFEQPPHPGPLLYEEHDWGMTGARWRALAAAAAEELLQCAS